ncbi:nuclease-related domain-containing protein [Bacillus piscicola]|uniref:nuclease-related domain-containing protein n=1 Tax=Bacillus piscicola TaxID=1632684 RepID=UPI001F098A05|nr:nuclease-related domain-containing protein [Bacillus piscicola]
MFIKERSEPWELRVMRVLHARMALSAEDKRQFFKLKKGFEGEKKFDQLLTPLSGKFLGLGDLLFDHNQTLFQIDTLLLSGDSIYLFDVKTFEGDYTFEEDHWHSSSGVETRNPIHQLHRSESLLRQLLRHLRLDLPIVSYAVFVHSEFTLYQAKPSLPLILPTQLAHYVRKWHTEFSPPDQKYTQLAERLRSLHVEKSPYRRTPNYEYQQLRKGVVCENCPTFMRFIKKFFHCPACKTLEPLEKAVIRSIHDFALLFPEATITTNVIYEWCNVVRSKRTIQKVLRNNFERTGHGKSTSYLIPSRSPSSPPTSFSKPAINKKSE